MGPFVYIECYLLFVVHSTLEWWFELMVCSHKLRVHFHGTHWLHGHVLIYGGCIGHLKHCHLIMACSDLHHHCHTLKLAKPLNHTTIWKMESYHQEGIEKGYVQLHLHLVHLTLWGLRLMNHLHLHFHQHQTLNL
jgi:hypothetical protein